jgi:hypothetical protein
MEQVGNILTSALQNAAQIGGQYLANEAAQRTPQKPATAAPAPAPAKPQPGWIKWALIGGGVLVVLVGLGFVMKRKG